MTHLEKIASDLELSTYKDPTHGKIAKENFEYGVAQTKLEALRTFKALGYSIINATNAEQWEDLKQKFEQNLTESLGNKYKRIGK